MTLRRAAAFGWMLCFAVACGGQSQRVDDGSDDGAGAPNRGGSAADTGGASGTGGTSSGGVPSTGGGGQAGSTAGTDTGGSAGNPSESCAAPEDPARFSGRLLYVDTIDPSCAGREPCFTSIYGAMSSAGPGETIVVAPGTYTGFELELTGGVGALRITGESGPEGTFIEGTCPRLTGNSESGELWIDHFTFRNCGPSDAFVEEGWGIYVTSWSGVHVRITDNVFEGSFGRGAVGLQSSTNGTLFHASIARNRFFGHGGEDSALDIDLPSDFDEDYCIRVENNLFYENTSALGIFYPRFRDGAGRFEIVNNTISGNERGVSLGRPAGDYVFANNIVFGNDADFGQFDELGGNFDMRSNLIGTGQWSGLRGNFASDPLFEDASIRDFRPLNGSPVGGRGDAAMAPPDDILGTPRRSPPAIGAYEIAASSEGRTGIACGDGVVQNGPTDTGNRLFMGFETCDDGNREDGDGCSSLCQSEPTAPLGLISMKSGSLCAIRLDATLSCWGDSVSSAPTGQFRQVAVSAYQACALRTDDSVTCWGRGGGETFAPTGSFATISGDYDQTCGVTTDGDIVCWERDVITLERPGPFASVGTNRRVCALSAEGDPTCWEPYSTFVEGPFLRIFPDNNQAGCGHRLDGELVCLSDAFNFVSEVPPAGFRQVSVDQNDACGLRPDGRVVYFGFGGVGVTLDDRVFVDVAADFNDCCGLSKTGRVYCSDDNKPQEEEE